MDTHTHTHAHTHTHTHTHIYTNGHRGRERTFDSSEMVDLLMAVTVRRHGWLTWTQPHLSFSRSFFFFFSSHCIVGRCSQVHISAPKTTFRRGVREGKKKRQTQEEIEGKMWEATMVRKREIIVGLTDYQWEILYCVSIKKKKNHCYRFIPRAKVMGFSEGNVGAKICDTHTSRTTNYWVSIFLNSPSWFCFLFFPGRFWLSGACLPVSVLLRPYDMYFSACDLCQRSEHLLSSD